MHKIEHTMRNLVLCAVALLLAACFQGSAQEADSASALRVRRGDFAKSVTLTGELEAATGHEISVPRLPSWQTSIKWIADDGSEVRQGERVVELDNTAFATDLDSKRQGELQARQELQQREAEWSADVEQKELDLERRSADFEKAKIAAAVPRDLLSEREYEDRQMKLRRATVEHAKARDVLDGQRRAIEADRANVLVRLGRAEREIGKAERAISSLVLTAPRSGIVVVRDLPWEGRKLQAGDTVFVGFPLATLPDLTTLQVAAALADVDDGRIAPGMRAAVTLDGFPDRTFGGRIASISAVAQESARASLRRAFKVVVALDTIDPQRMRPGLSARVVVDAARQSGVLMAPRAALDLDGKTPQARLDGGRLVPVTVGACNAQDCVVTSGLREGDRLEALRTPADA